MEYYIGNEEFEYSICFVTGTKRVGKSLLSRLLSTVENIEWIYEPYSLYLPIKLLGLGKLDYRYGSKMIRNIVGEITNDCILMRYASFRPNDVSFVYSSKSKENVSYRLNCLNSREDVKCYLEKKKVLFLFDIPELLPHIDIIRKVFPMCKIIHVIRNGFSVAKEMEDKGWMSLGIMKLKNVPNADITKLYVSNNDSKNYYIPYWLPDETASEFISTTDFGRGIMYWSHMVSLVSKKSMFDMEIKYEEIVSNPSEILNKVLENSGFCWSEKTKEVINEIENRREILDIDISDVLSKREKKIFYNEMREYGYECERLA